MILTPSLVGDASRPIGIFDSGIGGLTVTKAIIELLPHENLIYFGDTAHHPYGEKSSAAIQEYALRIAAFMLAKNCKMIVIACHTASALAYALVANYVGSQALVVNMLDPLIAWLIHNHQGNTLGLIATKQTIAAGAYQQKINDANVGINLRVCPTNLLAAAIEEFGDHQILNSLLTLYLQQAHLQNIQALILACTHYPIIKNRFARFYKKNKQQVAIIDAASITATTVKQQLMAHDLHNKQRCAAVRQFYVSDSDTTFLSNIKLFFAEPIELRGIKLP